MTDKSFPTFMTTDQRVLLSDWPPLAKLITKHSTPLKAGGYNPEAQTAQVLSELAIFDAYQGPYHHLFKQIISAYSTLARVRMAIQINNDDNLKENLTYPDTTWPINEKAISDLTIDNINRCRDELEDCLSDHNQQWEGQLFLWQMQITGALRDAGIDINSYENDEFSAPEPLSELLERFVSLNVTPPTFTEPLGFAQYFKLKAFLLIMGSLSRQHLPHEPKDIDNYMKAIKKQLQAIEKESKQISDTHETAIKDIMRTLNV